MISDELKAIFDSDEDGLLETPKKPKKLTGTDRLERSFLDIVEFYDEHGRIPSSETREISERKLGARLDGILANEEKLAALKHLDTHGLLDPPESPASIDELLAGDDLDLLEDPSGVLDTSTLPKQMPRASADEVAKRVKAEEFTAFESLFKEQHAALASGDAKLAPFPGLEHIAEGRFFVLNGVMLFIAEIREPEYKEMSGGTRRRERLRCVFENGTESAMYRQSLAIRLYESEGQVVVPADYAEVTGDDHATGYLYVLRSLSEDPQISQLEHLHKIGFTTGSIDDRIARAEKDPTYLLAPVEVVERYRTYNAKASALEDLLHRIFAAVRLDVTQINEDGQAYKPREWYVVPLSVINQAAHLVTTGDIVDYRYDPETQTLIHRNA